MRSLTAVPTLPQFHSIIKQFAKEFRSDPNHREFSWDHAHHYWKEFAADQSGNEDLAALHLSFYLASFGMYRGKSDLLNRDYKALAPAIKFLKKQANNGLADCLFSDRPAEKLACELKELSTRLRDELIPTLVRPEKLTVRVSDTLLSKLMLVTLDCVPAFDQQVKRALNDLLHDEYGKGDSFAARRLGQLIALARENKSLIECAHETLKDRYGDDYPLNRIFDLYLWRRGI